MIYREASWRLGRAALLGRGSGRDRPRGCRQSVLLAGFMFTHHPAAPPPLCACSTHRGPLRNAALVMTRSCISSVVDGAVRRCSRCTRAWPVCGRQATGAPQWATARHVLLRKQASNTPIAPLRHPPTPMALAGVFVARTQVGGKRRLVPQH